MASNAAPRTFFTRLAAGSAIALAAAAGTVTAASAHDYLVSSTPEAGSTLSTAPEALTLEFSGELTKVGDGSNNKVQLSLDGKDVDTSLDVEGKDLIVTPAAPLANGDYDLEFHIVSQDGHPVDDNLEFTVDAPEAASSKPSEPSMSTQAATPAEPSASDAADASQAPAEEDSSAMSPIIWVIIAVVVIGLLVGIIAKVNQNKKLGK